MPSHLQLAREEEPLPVFLARIRAMASGSYKPANTGWGSPDQRYARPQSIGGQASWSYHGKIVREEQKLDAAERKAIEQEAHQLAREGYDADQIQFITGLPMEVVRRVMERSGRAA